MDASKTASSSGSAPGEDATAIPEDATVGSELRRTAKKEKEPPSLKATVVVLAVLFLVLSPAVRWRFAEFNLWARSSLPYGGNPPFGVAPGGAQADMVTVEARFGGNSELMSGHYMLLPEKHNGRYTWVKKSPGQEAYLLWDDCHAWLISRFPTGNSPNCEGWGYTAKCYGLPWECNKTWSVREDGRWESAASSVIVTPFHGKQPKPPSGPKCSADREKKLTEQFGDFDIVIPWINGSDPQWLSDRARVCEDWQWTEMWSDAVKRSIVTKNCLKHPDSVAEATSFISSGQCAEGAFGKEGKCALQTAPAKIGLTTRSSSCFRKFVESHCTGRVNSIQDHDELRYLVRSTDRNLPWHRGRVLLVSPKNMIPRWLKPGGRFEVIPQEDLLQRAVSSFNFVSARDRGRLSDWAPSNVFNDYPIEAALAFIPKANRVMMLVQDDLLFARPASVCDFFTPEGELRLFARPFAGESNRDAFSQIYESMEHWTSKHYADFTKAAHGRASQYYRLLHLPHMLDKSLLQDLWKDHPEIMSDAVSSAFRHPNLTNTIAIHHSEAVRRHQSQAVAEAPTAVADDFDSKMESNLGGRINNLVMNISSGIMKMHELPWMEVVFESIADWHDKMTRIPPDPSKLPGIIGMQDNMESLAKEEIAKLDCLREKWLKKLLPGASSWEDPEVPPSMCRASKGSSKSKNASPKKDKNDEL